MHVARIFAALVFGGLASIALAHVLADAFRPIWGDQAAIRAVFGAPVVILFAAWVIVLLTRSPRQLEPVFTVQHNIPVQRGACTLDELIARADETLRLLDQIAVTASGVQASSPVKTRPGPRPGEVQYVSG